MNVRKYAKVVTIYRVIEEELPTKKQRQNHPFPSSTLAQVDGGRVGRSGTLYPISTAAKPS